MYHVSVRNNTAVLGFFSFLQAHPSNKHLKADKFMTYKRCVCHECWWAPLRAGDRSRGLNHSKQLDVRPPEWEAASIFRVEMVQIGEKGHVSGEPHLLVTPGAAITQRHCSNHRLRRCAATTCILLSLIPPAIHCIHALFFRLDCTSPVL